MALLCMDVNVAELLQISISYYYGNLHTLVQYHKFEFHSLSLVFYLMFPHTLICDKTQLQVFYFNSYTARPITPL